MKKITRTVDEENGIVQITVADERWYVRTIEGPDGDITDHVPSVTWIAGFHPKGVGFYKWLASKGWDEAEAIKSAAGNKGSKAHTAIAMLLSGETIPMDSLIESPKTGLPEELTLEEYEAIMSFAAWHKQADVQAVLAVEQTVWSEEHRYAGTLDLLAVLPDGLYLIDFKTSAYIWPEHHIQLSAYAQCVPNVLANLKPDRGFLTVDELEALKIAPVKMAILQLGYRRNRRGWKWTEIDDKFELFLAVRKIWENEAGNQKPSKREYPLEVSLH